MEIINIIKKILFENGLTQTDLANQIGTNQSQVSEWISGKNKPSYDNLRAICKNYNIDGNEILDICTDISKIKHLDSNKFTVVDLFAGVGGLSYGFAHNENFQILLANEYEKTIAKTYTLNHPNVEMLNCDIKIITEEMIKEKINLPVDIVIGGPPCQSYSTLGKRKNDDRANLFYEYCRLLEILKPKLFIFENVTGILSMNKGNLFIEVQEAFANLGYTLKYKVLNSAEYGVPQFRERVILVGTKGENNFEYPIPTHGNDKDLERFVSLEDALSDLPVLRSGEEIKNYATEAVNNFQRFVHDCDFLTDNKSPNNGEHLIRLMEALPDGGSKDDLPEEIRPKSGFGNTYAKMWWQKPAPTITRNFACPSSSRCIHPRDSRALSTREGARLQSFPDSYKFYGGTGMKNLQIGNAVPPLLSVILAKQVEKYFKKIK